MFIAQNSDVIDVKISCDGCDRTVSGRRFRSLTCRDLDLCTDCYVCKFGIIYKSYIISGLIWLYQSIRDRLDDYLLFCLDLYDNCTINTIQIAGIRPEGHMDDYELVELWLVHGDINKNFI